MSFGTKEYQHRFYTAPKLRDRHIINFLSPQPISNSYVSVSAFTPYPSPSPYHPHLQPSMKQSYIRLVNNGTNSRLYNKDELGYQGVKFEKDVISRYCSDDYKRNSEVLERFKKEAEESKKMQKYKHLRVERGREAVESNYYSNRPEGSNINTDRKNLQLLPITNSSSRLYHHNRSISSPQKLFSIKNTQNLINLNDHNISPYNTAKNTHLLPLLRGENQWSFSKNSNRQFNKVIEEEQSHNQNQDYGDGAVGKQKGKEKLKHSIVRDVGISAHLVTQQASQSYKKRNSQQILQNDRKKSQSLRVQTMKLKNKSMKKKYYKLKKQLLQKSVILSQHQRLEEERMDMEEKRLQREKFRNLQGMIQDLCNKLRENNSKMQGSRGREQSEREKASGRRQSIQSEKTIEGTNRVNDKQLYDDIYQGQDPKKQTQINTLKSSRLAQQSTRIKSLLKQQQIAQNIHNYQQQLQKIQNYRTCKPKIIYSINSNEKLMKHDGLRLLKNRIQEKHFHINVLGDYSNKKYRSKTEGNG